jgi:hypothetical protein
MFLILPGGYGISTIWKETLRWLLNMVTLLGLSVVLVGVDIVLMNLNIRARLRSEKTYRRG